MPRVSDRNRRDQPVRHCGSLRCLATSPASFRWSTTSSTTPRSSPSKASPIASRRPANAPSSARANAAKPSHEQGADCLPTIAASHGRRAGGPATSEAPKPILLFDQDGPSCRPDLRSPRPSRAASWTAASTAAPSSQTGDDAQSTSISRRPRALGRNAVTSVTPNRQTPIIQQNTRRLSAHSHRR